MSAFHICAQDVTDANINFKVHITREAHFPGGDIQLYKEIYQMMEYSEEARNAGLETEVRMTFFVEADSTISNISILSDTHGYGDSLRKFIFSKKFVPALLNGTPYRSQVVLNVPLRAH